VSPHLQVHSLLLVRNGVDHDARVLRAARVARRALGGSTLVVGVATASAPAGETSVEGVPVLRLPARAPLLARLARVLGHRSQQGRGAGRGPNAEPPRGSHSEAGSGPDGEAACESPGDAPREPHAPFSAPQLTPAERARRVLGGVSFTLQAVSVARRVKPRLVHANDWNTMWAGLLVKLLCGSRLVYDSHELWADRNGRWEWRPWLLACEALFVRAANEVLTSSPGYADALAARYRIPRPAVVRNIPESPMAESPILAGPTAETPTLAGPIAEGLAAASLALASPAARSATAASTTAASPRGHESPHADASHRHAAHLVVYVGGLMPGRGLEQMIDALPLLPEVRLRAVGPGAPRYRAGLLARARGAGVLDRVELCRPVAPGDVKEVLAEAGVGLCLIQPVCRSYELSLPNKLFEYAAAGVPVLASDLPVIGTLVRREGLGEVAPAGDPHAIAASLQRLLEPERRRLAAERAQAYAAAHSWAGDARTLAGVYGPTDDATSLRATGSDASPRPQAIELAAARKAPEPP
jgi:glycosyltransferase involved in cell wall biosynthesis